MSERIQAICPIHHTPGELVTTEAFYGRDYNGKRLWRCPVEGCDVRVGAHPDGTPLGTMATAEMRQARIKAHAAFDGWWKSQGMKRGAAYRELSTRLGVNGHGGAHISQMTVEECARVVALFQSPDVDEVEAHGAPGG